MSKTPTRTNYHRSRRGALNRSSVTVRLALSSMDFDGVVEWVKTFKQLEEQLKDATEFADKLAVIKVKFEKLENLFSHVYPKIKETELVSDDLVEMEAVLSEEAPKRLDDESTEALIGQLERNK